MRKENLLLSGMKKMVPISKFFYFYCKKMDIFTPVHVDEKSLRFNPCFFNL